MARKQKKKPQDGLKVRGFFHLQLVEHDDEGIPVVVGDSGWVQNQVTNLGFRDYLCHLIANNAASKQISRMCIGTGTAAIASDATTLVGELSSANGYTRTTLSTNLGGSTAMSFLATFGSAQSHINQTTNIANIALINSTAFPDGTIFAGNTYASSQWATNQDLNATYAITFAGP